jgi:hypothetical protein
MAYAVQFAHHVEIDGVPLSCAAWEHLNIQALYSAPPARGTNRVMPGARGQRAVIWRADATNRSFELVVFGDHHWDGAVNSDPVAGLWENLEHLRAGIVAPPNNADGARTAVIKRTGAADLTALIQVRGWEIGESYGNSNVAVNMDVTLLNGEFT